MSGTGPGDDICRIYAKFPDLLVYEECPERSVTFASASLYDPPCAYVPEPAIWAQSVPRWARGHRGLIIDRLRAAGIQVSEQGRDKAGQPRPIRPALIWRACLPTRGQRPAAQFFRPRGRLNAVAMAVLGLFMTAGGLFVTVTDRPIKDRLIGAAGMLMFGVATLQAVSGLRHSETVHRPSAVAHLPGTKPTDDRPTTAKSHPPILPFISIIALLLQVPWTVVMLFALLFIAGDQPFRATPAQENFLKAITVLPVALGALSGIVGATARWPRTPGQWTWLTIGSLACATCGLWLTGGLAK